MLVNLFIALVFIILALGGYFILRFIYRYNLKVKAENLERSRQEIIQREKEVIQQYSKEIDSGIYQIYGQHPAYGKDTLLYIGKAEI